LRPSRNEISFRAPSIFFFAKRSVFWILAILSILLGAMSFAILLFAVTGYFVDGGQSIYNVPLEEVLFSIPVLWIVTMPIFVVSAYFSVRHTQRGYRLRSSLIVALSMAASLGFGGFLHGFGAGRLAHRFLEAHVPYYERLTYIPYAEWSRPDEGYLGGHADELLDKNTLRLTDFLSKVWTVDISGAVVTLDNAVENEGDVAIRGVRTGPASFHAEKVGEFD
jgi:heme/copper-type cytochrome/quinol oxidase subunit 2